MTITQNVDRFILRYCKHFTCLSCYNQNAIKLENISNLLATQSSYPYKENTCKHKGSWILLLHGFPVLTSTSKNKLGFFLLELSK